MGVDEMMSFRLAYLRAIALSWKSPAFRRMMTDPGIIHDEAQMALLERDARQDGQPIFHEWETGRAATLPDRLARLPRCDREAADGWMVLGLVSDSLPSWNIGLSFRESTLEGQGGGFRPDGAGGWVGPRAELTLRLPKCPAVDGGERAVALTEYYAALPSPFGQGIVRGRAGGETASLAGTSGTGGQSTSAGSGGAGMGHSSDAFVLGGVVVRALALMWNEEQFRNQILGRDPTFHDAMEALENWLGYNCPWNINIRVEECEMEWTGGRWSPTPRNHLQMFVPPAPDLKYDYALAIAAYNQTGDAYPLTCP